ncbi:YegP family protein [Nocardia goodfellowii]
MAAKFEIFRDKNGDSFYFHLRAPNGEVIAASQGYTTKAAAEKGIKAIKEHAPTAATEDWT